MISRLLPETDLDNIPESEPQIYVTHKNKQNYEYSIDLEGGFFRHQEYRI